MKKEDKNKIIEDLTDLLKKYNHFYVTDISAMNAGDTSELRRKCFEREIELVVVKNTLLRKAMEQFDGKYDELFTSLVGGTSIMFTQQAGSVPAKLIKEFRKKHEKPVLKGAYVEESVYLGEKELDNLATLKTKEELIGEIIGLLQSPLRNVISSLESGKHTIAGLVKTLSER